MRIPLFWDVKLHCRIISFQPFQEMLGLQVSIIPKVSKFKTLEDEDIMFL